jgi:hypothetical protein
MLKIYLINLFPFFYFWISRNKLHFSKKSSNAIVEVEDDEDEAFNKIIGL